MAQVQCKSSRWQMFFKIAVRPETLLKKESNKGVFLQNLLNIYERLFLQNTSTLIAASRSKQCKPMKTYTESLSCRRKKWYTRTVILRLVFLDNEYSSEVSQTPHFCWHYPIFVTSHEKSRSSRPELFYKKRCFWKFRKPKVFSCEFPENFQEHLFSWSTSGDCFWKYKSRSSRPEVFYKKGVF